MLTLAGFRFGAAYRGQRFSDSRRASAGGSRTRRRGVVFDFGMKEVLAQDLDQLGQLRVYDTLRGRGLVTARCRGMN